MSYTLKNYTGGAVAARLYAAVSDTTGTNIVVTGTDATWAPLGSAPFVLSLSTGNSNEEKVLVAAGSYSWTGTSVTLTVTRGYDGTPASTHAAGDTVAHVLTGVDLAEANYAVTKTVGIVQNIGDILYSDAAYSLDNLAPGTAGNVLKTNGIGSAPAWASVASLLPSVLPSSVAASKVWNPTKTTTSTGPSQSGITGYNNYLVIAWSAVTTTSTAAEQLGLSITANGTTGINTVTQTVGATSNGIAVTFAVLSPGASTSFSASSVPTASGTGAIATWNNYLIVIGLN